MIALFIAVCGCIYFFLEARKRNVSPYKWAILALVAFMGPQLLLSWLLLPIVVVSFAIPVQESIGLQIVFGLSGVVIGFCLLVIARKRLYLYERTEPAEDGIVMESLEVVEVVDGSFAVGDRRFQSRKEAEAFVDFTQSIRR